jgi:hypothetical protein
MQCMVASGCVQPLLSDSLLHCTSTSCVHCVVVSRCVYALYHMLHNQCQHSALPCTVLFSDTHLKHTYTSATISNIPQDEGDVEFSYIPSDNGTNSSKSKNKSKSDRVLTAAELIAKKRADKALAAQLASETPFETYQRKAKEKKSAKRAAKAAKVKVIKTYIYFEVSIYIIVCAAWIYTLRMCIAWCCAYTVTLV